MKKLIELLNIGPDLCLELVDIENKPLYLEKIRLSNTHELTLHFSEDLSILPMSFVKDFIND